MYAKYGTVPVIFEVGRLSAKGGHAHVQAVPVPLRLKDKVEETFVKEGRPLGIDFEDDPEAALASCANGRGSYFKVDLPDGRKMVHLLKDRVPFSIQFGRFVVFLHRLCPMTYVLKSLSGRHWYLCWARLIEWIGRRACFQRKKTGQML